MTDSRHPPRIAAGRGTVSSAGLAGSGEPISEAVVEQAITWYVKLATGVDTTRQQAAFARWYASDPEHARAWQRVEGMRQRLQGGERNDSAALTHVTPTLLTFFSRRKTLKRLAWPGVIGAGLIIADNVVPWRRQLAIASADVHAPVGESRSVTLPDGTQLKLNTDTAIDLRFDARERRIVLRHGEILVATHKDAAGRPFIVTTRDGDFMPVGTRFTARAVDSATQECFTRLLVVEGAVKARSRQSRSVGSVLVRAGQQVSVTRQAVGAVTPANGELLAWIDGMFAVERMRLEDVLAELGRYRSGWLHCSREVADLRITGVWPLDQADATDRILESLARRLPVRLRRFTRYAVAITAA
ncbi:FecR domain-containing protein [Chitinasiproducens palmae]|uniref:FecR family protein n=1 Tax=Chitinasiproducens palmae TaxID=1770053 RepID=A0A1H2PT67_9BURK|nr:FecR domain-containing protein [Chitinasiproducens palmae]SDV50274.1 FecR family protein [Chitinasiproducens palmae]